MAIPKLVPLHLLAALLEDREGIVVPLAGPRRSAGRGGAGAGDARDRGASEAGQRGGAAASVG